LVPWKGISALIEVVGTLRAEGYPISLWVVGDGELRSDLEALAARSANPAAVQFLGSLARAEVGQRLQAADVFVLNTAYEGLSHQLLEAMSLRVPIITTPVGGNQELIRDGETGRLVPHNDRTALAAALRESYDNPSLGAARAARAEAVLREFETTAITPALVAVFQSVWK
jgi:glycosyltransferase involved in cell wall biosynthesis